MLLNADATPVQKIANEQSEQNQSKCSHQQKASQNKQQLSDLAAANATKETNRSYPHMHQISKVNATSQQIADIQNRIRTKEANKLNKFKLLLMRWLFCSKSNTSR